MNIISNINEWQSIRKEMQGKSIGFIATMGHLHSGHLSLCKRSMAENDITVVSIFVNFAQFNQMQDYIHYPRTIENDKIMLKDENIDYLFLPDSDAIYPDNYQIQVSETDLSLDLEGKFRPGHFNGMLTIVLKLLNIIQPTRAYFGEKDYQQLLLVKKMAQALFLPVEIIPCKTIRAEDGLALSSRNSRLNQTQREKATNFPRLLTSSLTTDNISDQLNKLGFKVDYIVDKWQRRLGAVWLDDVRLIDNIQID